MTLRGYYVAMEVSFVVVVLWALVRAWWTRKR